MTRDDIRKLLGGYATGSLTEAERKSLFEAALDDQELFDQLAREQALKEVLDEPGAKQRLIAALAKPEKRRFAWWPLAALAGAAVAIIVVFVSVDFKRPPQPVEMARIEPARAPRSEPVPVTPPVTAPVRDATTRDERDKSTVRAFENRRSPGSPSKPAESAKRAIPSAPAPAPEQAPTAARSKDLERQDVKQEANQVAQQQVQVQAAAPFADSGQRSQAAGAVGGVAGRFAAKKASPSLALNYSVEDGDLVLKFAATGYFSVHFSPGLDTIVDSRVAAGSTRRLHIPNNATEAAIVFSANPQSTSGGVSLTSDSKTGTASDPAGTRIELLVRFYP